MASSDLKKYTENLEKASKAAGIDRQVRAAVTRQFKASIVQNPLDPDKTQSETQSKRKPRSKN